MTNFPSSVLFKSIFSCNNLIGILIRLYNCRAHIIRPAVGGKLRDNGGSSLFFS